jgi:ParB/RepB/Spo0J family partition protein
MSTTLSLPAVRPISIGQLQESPTNPRKTFSEEKLRELAESIRSMGLIQPIIVRPIDQDIYQVVAGARRFRDAISAAGRGQAAGCIPIILSSRRR